jgi:hypothetical protein
MVIIKKYAHISNFDNIENRKESCHVETEFNTCGRTDASGTP